MKGNVSEQREAISLPAIESYRKQLAELVKTGKDHHFQFIDVNKLEEEYILLFGRYLNKTLDETDIKKRMQAVMDELEGKKIPFDEAIKDSRVCLLAYILNRMILSKTKK